MAYIHIVLKILLIRKFFVLSKSAYAVCVLAEATIYQHTGMMAEAALCQHGIADRGNHLPTQLCWPRLSSAKKQRTQLVGLAPAAAAAAWGGCARRARAAASRASELGCSSTETAMLGEATLCQHSSAGRSYPLPKQQYCRLWLPSARG